jgi:hypothetical protein
MESCTKAGSDAVTLNIISELAPIKGGKMTRDAGTIRERIFNALIQRYKADGEAALVRIDALIRGEVLPGHEDTLGSIDKQLAKIAFAEEKMATLRRHYGTN